MNSIRQAMLGLACILMTLQLIGCTEPSHEPESVLEVASVGLNAGRFSERGEFACVGSLYHGISLWRTSDRERLFDWNHKKNESTVLIDCQFTPDGKWAITADVSTLVLWNTETGEGVRYWQAPGEILSVALSPDGRFALLGLNDHTAVLFNIQAGGVVRTLHHNNRVRSVDISADGKIALTGSEDFKAIAWNLKTGEAISTQQHNDDVQLVKLSSDGSLALSVSKYDSALLWKTSDGSKIGELDLGAQKITRGLRFTSARFSEDNNWLLTGRPDQIISLWSTKNLEEVERWKIPKRRAWKPQGASIIDVAFAPQQNRYFGLSSNGFIGYLSRP